MACSKCPRSHRSAQSAKIANRLLPWSKLFSRTPIFSMSALLDSILAARDRVASLAPALSCRYCNRQTRGLASTCEGQQGVRQARGDVQLAQRLTCAQVATSVQSLELESLLGPLLLAQWSCPREQHPISQARQAPAKGRPAARQGLNWRCRHRQRHMLALLPPPLSADAVGFRPQKKRYACCVSVGAWVV